MARDSGLLWLFSCLEYTNKNIGNILSLLFPLVQSYGKLIPKVGKDSRAFSEKIGLEEWLLLFKQKMFCIQDDVP